MKRMTTQLKDEQRWLARGVTGRRKRNQGRLARLHDMRATHGAMRAALNDRKTTAEFSAGVGRLDEQEGDRGQRPVEDVRHARTGRWSSRKTCH